MTIQRCVSIVFNQFYHQDDNDEVHQMNYCLLLLLKEKSF